MSMAWRCPTPVPPGVAGLLQHRATTLEPQWDPTHRGLHRVVRGVPRDGPTLQVVEVLLRCLPTQEGAEREEGKREFKVLVGSTSIRLWGNRATQYMSLSLMTLNKGWHKQWFYLRNDPAAPSDLLWQLHRVGTEDVGVGSPR
jgi:hypothetical protein